MTSALITVTGYPDWPNADVNGSNAVIYENDTFHLYFTDFNSTPLRVHHATSSNQRDFTYQGWVLDYPIIAQDVKKLDFGGQPYYAMLLHQNTNQIGYSIGTSLTSFSNPQTLFYSQNLNDQYITSGSFVTSNNRIYGILYGASSVASLDKNAIYAKWLQKKVIFKNESVHWGEPAKALGPNRIILSTSTQIETGRFYIYDTDAMTLLFVSPTVSVRQGDIWNYVTP
ncbi:MAG: hypothetical protein MUC73_10895 [Cyclobacteriaceae bacterium]|nr:hypothetical protein [Cyclobacteriaceae bacterium]